MLWGENCAEWVAAFFGCALSGVIVVPMDDGATFWISAMRVFQQVQGKLLVGSRRHGHEFAVAGLPIASLTLEEVQAQAPSASTPCEYWARARRHAPQIVFTSGTTADPKGVVITHGNVLANIAPLEQEMRGYLKYERLVHPLRFLNLLPLSHVFGQFLAMYLPPLLGGTVIFQDELEAFRGGEHHPARAGVGGGVRAARTAGIEAENRARRGRPGRVERSAPGSLRPRANIFSGTGGLSAPFDVSLVGNSGLSFPAALPLITKLRSSGGGSATRRSRDTG